jgi:hypothetical protein
MSKSTRHGSIAEQLKALMAYRNRPEEEFEPMQTNWSVTPAANDNDPEEVADMGFERKRLVTPSVQAIMDSVATGEVETNDRGQTVRIGRLRFSDGNQTEVGYVLGIDGDVIQADIRMPTGSMLGSRDKTDVQSGGGADPRHIVDSNHYFAATLDTQPSRYIPSKKRRNGQSFTAEQSAQTLAEAYANTDMSKVTYTRYPKGLPCGSPKIADSFLGMRKTTCAGGGGEAWEDTLSAMIERNVWFDALQDLKDRDREVLDMAMGNTSLESIGRKDGYGSKYATVAGRRRLMVANDNFAAILKKCAA